MAKKWKFRVISISAAVAALSFGGGMLRCDARSLTAGAISQQELPQKT